MVYLTLLSDLGKGGDFASHTEIELNDTSNKRCTLFLKKLISSVYEKKYGRYAQVLKQELCLWFERAKT